MPETASPADYKAKLATTDIMIGWPEFEWLLPNPIKLLLCPSVGYDGHLTPALAAKQGFPLCNSSGVYSEGVAEHCLAMMMAYTEMWPTSSSFATVLWRQWRTRPTGTSATRRSPRPRMGPSSSPITSTVKTMYRSNTCALRAFASIEALYCLPPELQDKNSTGKMWRYLDGEWTQGELANW